jgi:F420H(2)-dependent quinone reductase
MSAPASPYPPTGTGPFYLANTATRLHVALYRWSRGRLGGNVLGAPVLLLDHVGRRSGTRRTSPLHFLADGQAFVVVGSRGGSDKTPAWWINLRANPQTTVQVGRKRHAVIARQADPAERARLWPRLVQLNSDYAIYQERTARQLPVIILDRVA